MKQTKKRTKFDWEQDVSIIEFVHDQYGKIGFNPRLWDRAAAKGVAGQGRSADAIRTRFQRNLVKLVDDGRLSKQLRTTLQAIDNETKLRRRMNAQVGIVARKKDNKWMGKLIRRAHRQRLAYAEGNSSYMTNSTVDDRARATFNKAGQLANKALVKAVRLSSVKVTDLNLSDNRMLCAIYDSVAKGEMCPDQLAAFFAALKKLKQKKGDFKQNLMRATVEGRVSVLQSE